MSLFVWTGKKGVMPRLPSLGPRHFPVARLLVAMLLLAAVAAACGGEESTPASAPTQAPNAATLTPSPTPTATSAPEPTPTPDAKRVMEATADKIPDRADALVNQIVRVAMDSDGVKEAVPTNLRNRFRNAFTAALGDQLRSGATGFTLEAMHIEDLNDAYEAHIVDFLVKTTVTVDYGQVRQVEVSAFFDGMIHLSTGQLVRHSINPYETTVTIQPRQ